jgi:putative component of membrane protein insertase Oxa1/YidC/SpoIIIJ protein YidD
MIGAIKKYGVLKGLSIGINRIGRCTPNREHTVDQP